MNHESRVHKSLLNARVNLIFYFLSILMSLFSRKIFLDNLGAEFIGLAGTLSNIFGLLNLAEMGIGTAVAFTLYKPLTQGDKKSLEEIVSVFGFLYHKVGKFVLVGAVIVGCFFPLIFKDNHLSYGIIYFSFLSSLLSAMLGYFINYRSILLSADQKGYVVTIYTQSAGYIKLIAQMLVAAFWQNYYVWIALDIVFTLFGCIILNWKIDQTYPWLHASAKLGKSVYPSYKHIIQKTKQVFIHRFSTFLHYQSDQILIFAFVSLKMVAYYGNYTLIAGRISSLFESVFAGFGAGVGNLIAEGDDKRSESVFWELVSVRFFTGGFLVFTIYWLIEPFIALWLGDQYVLDRSILMLMLLSIFIQQTRNPVDMFKDGYGLYADTWAPVVQIIINICITLIAAPTLGIAGILLGKLASHITIPVFWRPYYLFKHGFKQTYLHYWQNAIRYYLAFAIAVAISIFVLSILPYHAVYSLFDRVLKSILTVLVFTPIYFLSLYILTPGSRVLRSRIQALIFKGRKHG